MGTWEFIPVDVQTGILSEFRRYAPATCVVGDWLYLTHSESGRIIRTRNPRAPSQWEDVGRPQGWMDPGMLYDDPATGGDGYVYLYKGLSHFEPIDVIRLDPKNGMQKAVPENFHCAWPDRENRGFEVPGDDSLGFDGKDTQEGAWPVKHGGRYYLTCAVPGTQYAGYCDNCYVGDSPIGPFTLCKNSPVIWKSTGYTRGAGHGCSRDPFGVPGPGWNLLYYGKRAVASSNAGTASLAFDEDMGTCWAAASGASGEWLAVDLGKIYGVWSVQVNFTTLDASASGRGEGWAYRYLLEFSQNGKDWFKGMDRTNAKPLRQHEYVEFAHRVGARFVRVTNTGDSPAGSRFAINGLRVFGAKALHGLGPRGTSVTFRDVKGTECRRLRISYSTQFPAKIAVTVNGGAPFTVALPATRGWPTYMTQDVTLPEQRLVASNTVMVEGLGDAFSLDWIQLLR